MKKSLQLLCLFAILTILKPNFTFAQKPDCKSFRIGRFELVDNDNKLSYIIERNDSIQSEENLQTGIVSKFKITWINECEYSLQMISGSTQAMEFYKGKKLIIKILETTSDSYKFSSMIEGYSKVMYQTLTKVKNK